MPFAEFIGNEPVVARLRELIATGGMNRTVIFSGPSGVGKTTLAIMAGLALNCMAPPQPGDFCGACASCRQLVPGWRDLGARTAEALEFREQQVKTRAREDAPLVVQLHPQIELFPADGDFLTIHQARLLSQRCQRRSDAGRTWAFILPDLDRARWMVQASLLKTLEEPPPRTTIFALARNPLELLPTVRSRSLILGLAPAGEAEIATLLGRERAALPSADRALLARLAEGRPGRALSLDLAAYRELREQALLLLATGLHRESLEALFALTGQALLAGRTGKEKLESLAEILYSLLQDILYLIAGRSEAIRNLDCRPELMGLAPSFTMPKLALATEETDRILSAARRNANRGLALEAWALRLAQA